MTATTSGSCSPTSRPGSGRGWATLSASRSPRPDPARRALPRSVLGRPVEDQLRQRSRRRLRQVETVVLQREVSEPAVKRLLRGGDLAEGASQVVGFEVEDLQVALRSSLQPDPLPGDALAT